MRIVQVQGLVGGGGSEVHTSILSRGLRERGHEVLVCIPDQDHWIQSEVESAGCSVARFPLVPTWRRLFDVEGGRWLAQRAREFDADVVHSHIWNADVMAYFSRRSIPVPLVTTLHGPTISISIEKNLLHKLHHRVYAYMLRRFDRIIAISDFVKTFVANDLKIDLDSIDVVHNCSDVDRYAIDVDRSAIRSRLAIPMDSLVVIIVGELSPRKGILEFVRAASEIAKEVPKSQFLVVGRGILHEDAVRLADSLSMGQRIHFLGQRSDVAELLRASDLLAMTSYQEGFGRTITEAMSCALPVVCFRSGATPEIVIDDETGFLTPEGDVVAFARACSTLLSDEGLRARFGRAGLERAKKEFDIGPFVSRTERILADAAAGRAHNRRPTAD